MKDTQQKPRWATASLIDGDREQLSKHYTLLEFTISSLCIDNGWENTPDDLHIYMMRQLCEHILEPMTRRFGKQKVLSGFRTKQLNAAMGGGEESQHLFGQAVDLYIRSSREGKKMFDFIVQELDFDMLVYEVRNGGSRQFLHVSYNPQQNRRFYCMDYRINN